MRKTYSTLIQFSIVSLCLIGVGCQPGNTGPLRITETPEQRDQRMAWWRQAKFGMFIHWGLYSIPAGQWKGQSIIPGPGEGIMYIAKIPPQEYEILASQFNPAAFDAKAWVALAKQAGMKYVVITSKHHEGFCLFDSAHTDYDVMDATPFKRDIIKELAEECRKQKITLGLYYSFLNWHHPDYLPRVEWDRRPADTADYSRYVEIMKNQIKELLTRYGRIGVMWFDGEWDDTWTHDHGLMLCDYIRRLQPDILINNRIDKGRQGMAGMTKGPQFVGDFGTPEQEIPETGWPGVDWESCMTMNDTWGFRSDDQNWKSAADLIHKLVDIASKGGNFLLNVGPTAEGRIPQPSVERLQAIGEWMDVNSESIYNTTASPFHHLPWGRCTVKGNTLYLHVLDWPSDGKLVVPGLETKIKKAFFLADNDRINRSSLLVNHSHNNAIIRVPSKSLDPIDTVVVLELVDKPRVMNP